MAVDGTRPVGMLLVYFKPVVLNIIDQGTTGGLPDPKVPRKVIVCIER